MTTIEAHYDGHLAEVYSWMFGDASTVFERNRQFFAAHKTAPQSSGLAIDLGAGNGFQSIPLAQIGFSVIAIDLSSRLLRELQAQAANLNIRCELDDLLNFPNYCQIKPELIVCMGDTLTHLGSLEDVSTLIQAANNQLIVGGKLILSFRDYFNNARHGNERFIPVQSDENRILTCLLEYEPGTVLVTDILHERNGAKWNLKTSSYRKLRINPAWIIDELEKAKFKIVVNQINSGMFQIVAQR